MSINHDIAVELEWVWMGASPAVQGDSAYSEKNVTCDGCGYHGAIDTFLPTMSLNNDIRCPECRSTNNKHNDEYSKQLFAAMRRAKND